MKKNLVGMWVNLARAYEIAKLGGLKISIVFDKEYRQGFSDYEEIKNFYGPDMFSDGGEIVVEIYKPEYNDSCEYETLSDIHKRVDLAKSNKRPELMSSNACDALLKTAVDRLGFSLSKRESIVLLSGLIAQLDGTTRIEPQHIAEAIQYNVIYNDVCNAETKCINFGDGISITTAEMDVSDVENAIEYLRKLI